MTKTFFLISFIFYHRSESYVPDPNARPDYRILIEFNDYLV